MKATEFIRKALDSSAKAILPMIDDMRDCPLTFPTPNGGNHPLWVMGHVAFVEGQLVQHIMLGKPNPLAEWSPLFGMKSEPTADAGRYPPLEEVKSAFVKLRAETLQLLDSLSDDDLDQPCKACPPGMEEFIGKYHQCFMILVMNTMTHRGQVADARRAAGRKPLRM
jgi:hypothetical protein